MRIRPAYYFSLDIFPAPMYGDGASLTGEKLAKPLCEDLISKTDYLQGSWKNKDFVLKTKIEEPEFMGDAEPSYPVNRIVQPASYNEDVDVCQIDSGEEHSPLSDSDIHYDTGDSIFNDSDVRPLNVFKDEENGTYVYTLQDLEYGISEEAIDMILKLVEPDKIMGTAVELAVREPSELINKLGIQIQHGDGTSEIEMIFEVGDATSLENVYIPIMTSFVNRNKTVLVKHKYDNDHSELIISLDHANHEIDITVDDFDDIHNKNKLIPLIKEFILDGFSVNLDIKEERPSGVDDFSIQQICGEIFNETKIQIELTEVLKPELNEDEPCFRLEPQKVGKKI